MAKVHFWIMNKLILGQPYGATRYHAELRMKDGTVYDSITFTDPDIPEMIKGVKTAPEFLALGQYINSLYVIT